MEVLEDYGLEVRSLPLTTENLSDCDCVIIVTDHSSYDYQMIVDNARLVVDTRNATRHVARNREKVAPC